MPVSEPVEEEFGFAEAQPLSKPDLYAGKIVAALDRQHPRDLFDCHILLEQDAIDSDLRSAFIVYLISHNHSPHSLLCPDNRDIQQSYERSFSGMTGKETPLETLLATRERLVHSIKNQMPDEHKEFLMSFYRREPNWPLLGLDGVEALPAIRWRERTLIKRENVI